MSLIVTDATTGCRKDTLVTIPEAISNGRLLSSLTTHWGCDSTKLGPGKIMEHGKARAEINAGPLGSYTLWLTSPDIDDFNTLREQALLLLGYTQDKPVTEAST